MTKTTRKHGADDIATAHAKSQKKISKKLESASNAQAVMAGFGDAYRSWVEALSREPQKLADMQSRFMQGQLELWNRTMQPKREGASASVHDSRFSAPEWGEFPAFDGRQGCAACRGVVVGVAGVGVSLGRRPAQGNR